MSNAPASDPERVGAHALLLELEDLHVAQAHLRARIDFNANRQAEIIAHLRQDAARPAAVTNSGGDRSEPEPVAATPELGDLVQLRGDLAGQQPAVSYVFEEYDSGAPVESNCTLIDTVTGDWSLASLAELVRVVGGAPSADPTDEEAG